MTARKQIEAACKALGLSIIELVYDRGITYTGGGWDLVVSPVEDPADEHSYGEHEAAALIDRLKDDWEPPKPITNVSANSA